MERANCPEGRAKPGYSVLGRFVVGSDTSGKIGKGTISSRGEINLPLAQKETIARD